MSLSAKEFALLQKKHEPDKRFAYHTTHQPPLIGMYTEGRFRQLAYCWRGRWEKATQELEIKGVFHPDPAGWEEVQI
jgi:hypothetical protein